MPRISALPSVVGSLASTDLFAVVQGSITKKVLFSTISSAFTVGPGAVGTTELADGSVTENKLLSSPTNDAIRAVTTDHIRDGAVTTGKIAAGAVTGSSIPNGSITASKLVPATLSISNFNAADASRLSVTGQVRTGTTVVSSGYVKSIAVIAGGSYSSAPTVTIAPPPSGGVQATATATITGSPGPVTSIVVTNPGSGYTSTPAVSFSSGSAQAYAYTILNGLISSQASGPNCTLFITTDEKVKVLGNSVSGQLGTGTASADDLVLPLEPNFNSVSTSVPTPIRIYGACASSYVLCSDGSVWSSGENAGGQLGLGDAVDRTVFTQIPSSSFSNKPIVKIAVATLGTTTAVGTSVLALAGDGTVYAWGLNAFGQLGLGGFSNQLFPLAVPNTGPSGTVIRDIVIGGVGTFICSALLTASGTVRTAGYTRYGAMAQGGGTASPYRQVNFVDWLQGPSTPVTNVKKVIITADASTGPTIAALTNAGVVWVAGGGNRGQLGNGSTASTVNGYATSPISSITDLVCPPGNEPCFIGITSATPSTGAFRVWGYNNAGQLGLTTASPYAVTSPQVSGPTNVNFSSVVISSQTALFTYALATDGRVFAAGTNTNGQLGNASLTAANVKSFNRALINRSDIVDIVITGVGATATAEILTSDGKVYKCGNNQAGQLGRGTIVPSISRNWSNVLF